MRTWLEQRNKREKFERAFDMGLVIDTIEVGVRWSLAARLYQEVSSRLKAIPHIRAAGAHSSHSYPQGTNFYFTIRAQPPSLEEAPLIYDLIWKTTMEAALEIGGTICHHHGIGKVRIPWIVRALGEGYKVLAQIKTALDPSSILNPGTLFPVHTEIGADYGPTAAVDMADSEAKPL